MALKFGKSSEDPAKGRSPAPAPQAMGRQTFLANLRQSNLVSPEQMGKLAGRLGEARTAQAVARVLVDQGLLTRFQAELLLAGKTSGFFLGQYRILDHIGKGGMGRVFKAEHQTMNRIVAVKVLASHLMKTPRAQQMFQREVRAAARLVHPNIVTAYDANQFGDRYYLVMEFVDGPNVEELVRQRGPLPVGLACDIIKQAASGLQCAHELGMVHRDIKPANLLVQRAGAPNAPCTIKILDFGLARLHSSAGGGAGAESLLAVENTVLGTPDFLSPEQARNLHQVDIRSDIYSLGCTFFFALTGKPPFQGGTALEKLVRHSTAEAPAVEQLRPEVSPPVAAIVRKMRAKNPAQRFQTPAELAAALAPFAVGGPGQFPGAATGGAGAASPPAPNDNDEEWAIGTLPVNPGPGAPMSFIGLPSLKMARAMIEQQSDRFRIALVAAVGIVVGLILLVGLLFILR